MTAQNNSSGAASGQEDVGGRAPGNVDFATALFTGDLFGELPDALPILTLDLQPPDESDSDANHPASSPDEPALYGVNKPAFERITLSHDRVHAKVYGRMDQPPTDAHLVDASVSGLLVRLSAPVTLPGEEVDLVVGLAGDLDITFPARVVRAAPTSLAVHYYASDSTLRFRLRFLSEALSQLDAPPWLEIRPRRPQTAQDTKFDKETREMAVLWSGVIENFADKHKHEAFLNACIKVGRLDYALERYRIFKRENREVDVDEYVKQIGTILGFYVLARNPAAQDEVSQLRKRVSIVGLFVILALIALIVAQEMVSRMSDSRSSVETPSILESHEAQDDEP